MCEILVELGGVNVLDVDDAGNDVVVSVETQVREIGDETIFQATGRLRHPDGTPRDLSYIGFIACRDRMVTRWQDYMNPLQLSARAR